MTTEEFSKQPIDVIIKHPWVIKVEVDKERYKPPIWQVTVKALKSEDGSYKFMSSVSSGERFIFFKLLDDYNYADKRTDS